MALSRTNGTGGNAAKATNNEETRLRVPIDPSSGSSGGANPQAEGVHPPTPAPSSGSHSPGSSTSAAPPPPQFEPGAIIAGRYKITGLIGRGGMGEVYNAFDQTLEQDVALKFLSAKYTVDPVHAQHLLNEVRMARRVSHHNVCRVHDVSTFQGQTFVSMELIEGEDLGTLIRRVGRLSGERAFQIAREMCIGLAAAHEQGVLHRDFKPANVLIDRDGHVHLADFGLSALLAEGPGTRHHGGTPAYMPPEQLLGDAVGPKGDIFGLGLVLFEMFTGKPVFRPKDTVELLDLHQKGVPPPSSVEPSIDPGVEHAIRWCLERSPDDRPESPLIVAAELPGGSLVKAALDAGLTLSPELVASAGSKGVMAKSVALAWVLAAVLLGIVGVRLSRSTELAALVPLEKSTDVLADSARTILKKLGYVKTSHYEAFAFDYYEELMSELMLRDTSPHWWDLLEKPRPSPIDFWYRRHTRPLMAESPSKQVNWLDPAPEIPGMISVRLDPGGRLRELMVVTTGIVALPEELTDPSVATLRQTNMKPDPGLLFEAAGLDPARFDLAPTNWVPPVYCDEVVSFSGAYPDNQAQLINVNMGFFHGWPVSFRITEKRLESASQFKQIPSGWQQNAGITIQLSIIILTTIGATFLARQNVMAKRSDRDGAFRVSTAAFALAFSSFLLRADHSSDFHAEADILLAALANGVFFAATFLVFYLAIEPHARREWPECLYAWSRLMKDRWTDPLVGQSLVVGVCAGLVAVVLTQLHTLSPLWLGDQPGAPMAAPDYIAQTLEGGRLSFGVALDLTVDALRFALLYLTGIVLLLKLTKRRLLAIGIYAAIHAVAWSLDDLQTTWLSWIFGVLIAAIATGVLVRFGLLALAVAAGTFLMLTAFPIQLDPSTWYFSSSLFAIGLVGACGLMGAAAASGIFSKNPE